MEASNDKSLKGNVFNNSNLLKSAVIYGHNASGKSNFIKALIFFKEFILFSHTQNANDKIPVTSFKLDKKYLKKPSFFEIEFLLENKRYQYSFSCDEINIFSEKLYEDGKKIFNREQNNEFKFANSYSKYKKYSDQTLENMLLLSRAVNLKDEGILKQIYLWIKDSLNISLADPMTDDFEKENTAELILKSKKFKKKVLNILESCDLGIVDIEVTEKSEDDLPTNMISRKMKRFLIDEYKIEFIHEQEEGDKINYIKLKYDEESTGTQKIFNLSSKLIEGFEKNKIIIIDELEKNLHPLILQHLVQIYNDRKNKLSQLIFTTHNTDLLNLNILRRDQIWFMEKDPNKNTSLVSIFDFKGVRKDLDIKKAYYSGRFGAIPIITDD